MTYDAAGASCEPLSNELTADMRAMQVVIKTVLSLMFTHNPGMVPLFLGLKASALENLRLMPITSAAEVVQNHLTTARTEALFAALEAAVGISGMPPAH